MVSAANQAHLEIRLNSNTAIMNAQLGIIDKKLGILAQNIKLVLEK